MVMQAFKHFIRLGSHFEVYNNTKARKYSITHTQMERGIAHKHKEEKWKQCISFYWTL